MLTNTEENSEKKHLADLAKCLKGITDSNDEPDAQKLLGLSNAINGFKSYTESPGKMLNEVDSGFEVLCLACKTKNEEIVNAIFSIYAYAWKNEKITKNNYKKIFIKVSPNGFTLLQHACSSRIGRILRYIEQQYNSAVSEKIITEPMFHAALTDTSRKLGLVFSDISGCRDDDFLLKAIDWFKERQKKRLAAELPFSSRTTFPMLFRALYSGNPFLIERICGEMIQLCTREDCRKVLSYKSIDRDRGNILDFFNAGRKSCTHIEFDTYTTRVETALFALFDHAYDGQDKAEAAINMLNDERNRRSQEIKSHK